VVWSCVLASHVTSKITHTPRDYKEALCIPHWGDAMNGEFFAMQTNGTWRLVPPAPGINLIVSHWIFKVKLHADGYIE
jgi:hypothetical protein